MMHEFAPAKLNLYLHVVGRRADGYHLLDSLAVFPCVGDTVRAADDATVSLALAGPFGAALSVEPDNLVLRAARALAEACGITTGARLVLEKCLPVASGIGGGSADAAATLRLLARLWGLHHSPMLDIAATLGADVPVCMASRPARMSGIGQHLGAAPALPKFGLVLVNPGVSVATPAVFRARTGDFSPVARLPAGWTDVATMAADLAALRNDLETPAIALYPAIAEALAALRRLPGCRLARMSGSGATCWGLFDDPAAAAAATAGLTHPGWWVWGGGLV